ncbi:B3GALT1 [Mytilus edulis]|uniref:B3GALT1 n=1 Tax=Mytilus edulis TaxID=6550 RepID=A0A8S3UEV7_MYTED|nr:B3GALT1 [Mytilus edulis]
MSKEIPNSKRFVRKELTKGKGISNRTIYKGMNISTEFENFYRNISEDKLENPLLHKHQYRALLNNAIKCKGKGVLLLVFIHSSAKKFLERQQIRSTYGSFSDYENEHIEYIFVLGQTLKPEIQQKINKESEKYMDIVQGNFVDSYRNLTYKLVFSLFWVNNFCSNAKFVVKVDDDVIVNLPLLIQHLQQKKKDNLLTNVLECYMLIDTEPFRQNNSKWRTSLLEYPFPTYPPYCNGNPSIMSVDVIIKMYDTTKEVPFLWLEDVYGGGFLPWISNIEMHQPTCYGIYVTNENIHGNALSWLILSIYKTNNFELLVGTNDLTSDFDSQIRIPIFSTEIPNSKDLNISEDKLENPLLHKHQYRALLNNDMKCKGKGVFLLVFVHSSARKFLERQQIRSTYGSILDYENEHIEYVFVLGQTPKPEIQQRINDESEKYMDIVQVKVDDDVIINIPLLIQHLRQKTKENLLTNVLECYMLTDTEPMRHNNSKWRTSLSEYRYPTFPPYCDGFSSIMSIDVIRKMYNTTKEVPFLWLEDVYGGGFLPWISNIEMHQPYCYSAYVESENWNCKLFVRAFVKRYISKRYMGTHQTQQCSL